MVDKACLAAGQPGACLHTMIILQAYQADLLRDLDEGEGVILILLYRFISLGHQGKGQINLPALVAFKRHL